jgi:hypothetical protein
MWGGIGVTDILKSVRYVSAAGSLLIQLGLHDQEVVCAWMTAHSEAIFKKVASGLLTNRELDRLLHPSPFTASKQSI